MEEHSLLSQYKNCRLCRRLCDTDRTRMPGRCGMTSQLFAARAALHFWEEPCISGQSGSGAVFFSGCSLGCVYCQNHDIALGRTGKAIDIGRLADIFLELMAKGAANINLVTPTHYVPSILAALDRARAQGLTLPIVYNTGNYETLDTLKALEGYVDIYLPDFKYWSPELAGRYSGAPDYAEHAAENLAEMFRQVGTPVFAQDVRTAAGQDCPALPAGNFCKSSLTEIDFCEPDLTETYSSKAGLSGSASDKDPDESEACLMKRGIIVRHLALPGALEDSKRIIAYLYKTYGNSVYLSIMSQFTPLSDQLADFPELDRTVTEAEYEALVDYAIELGVENAFIQEGEAAEESFIPPFNCEGV
ncbi:MAG: radical SAM protein [Lachnospiraceae bacterium]|nr:radical SAM protein [Lachnospiraceae bacterium]